MTRNEVHEQIVNCHCRLRKRIHNSTVNKKSQNKKKIVVISLYFAHQNIVSCQRTLFGLIIVQTKTILMFYDMLSTLTTMKRKDIIIEKSLKRI